MCLCLAEDLGENLDHSAAEEEKRQGTFEDEEGNELPHVILEGRLKIPSYIFSQHFNYQKVEVQWFWELD